MASCKDCVHVEVCKEYVVGLAAVRGVNLNMDELEAVLQCDDCEDFKDRSRFVELPCKVGDTIYVLDHDNAIDEFFTKKKNIVEERHVWRIEIHKNNEFRVFDTPAYGEPPKKIGETMFFTKKAAEQALKECEENANRNDT